MKKHLRTTGLVILGAVLMLSGPVFAESSATVMIQGNEVVSGDKYVRAQILRNEGTIKGDLVFWAQNVSSQGTIEGDVIGGGQDVNLAGAVRGNVRVGGGAVNLAGQIGKNVTVFGAGITQARDSVVNGSLRAFGGKVELAGKVKGNVRVVGGSIVLGGEFFGNVDVNDFDGPKGPASHGPGEGKLTVLPGTVVHGTLTFRGANADIQAGAKVGSFQWDKSKPAGGGLREAGLYYYLWRFVRLLVTTAIYFLLGLVLLRLFPAFFGGAADFVSRKPWSAVGYGLIALFSTIAAAVACVVLLVGSLVMSPAFGIVSGLAATAFYALLFFLALVPAALWLGTLMFRDKPSAYRLGAGLIVLKGGLFLLMVSGTLPAVGAFFPALAFVVKFGVVVMGSGALLRSLRESYMAAKTEEVG